MDVREGLPTFCNNGPTGDSTMQMATTLRRSTHTFLTHLFGPGLDDDRYVLSGSSRKLTARSAPGAATGRRRRAGARLPARSSP